MLSCYCAPASDPPMLLSVLVSGNNDSLRQAVLRGLQHMFEVMAPLRDGRLRNIDPQQVADLFAIWSLGWVIFCMAVAKSRFPPHHALN